MGWETGNGCVDPLTWAAKMKDFPPEAVKIFAFEVFNRVVERTPVDTGQLRQNWLVSVGQEDHNVLGAEVKVKKIKKRKGENAGKTITKRTVKLERSAQDTMRAGHLGITFSGDDTIYIQNNLSYAKTVEYGWYGKWEGGSFTPANTDKVINGFSRQHGAKGMIGATMAMADRLWEKAVKAAKAAKGIE
jgi:hypothetical protein